VNAVALHTIIAPIIAFRFFEVLSVRWSNPDEESRSGGMAGGPEPHEEGTRDSPENLQNPSKRNKPIAQRRGDPSQDTASR
jgi:hypothetical protein